MNKGNYFSEAAMKDIPKKKLKLEIRDGSVTEKKIANNAVTTDKIKNGAVTYEKLSEGITSDIKNDVAESTYEKMKEEFLPLDGGTIGQIPSITLKWGNITTKGVRSFNPLLEAHHPKDLLI